MYKTLMHLRPVLDEKGVPKRTKYGTLIHEGNIEGVSGQTSVYGSAFMRQGFYVVFHNGFTYSPVTKKEKDGTETVHMNPKCTLIDCHRFEELEAEEYLPSHEDMLSQVANAAHMPKKAPQGPEQPATAQPAYVADEDVPG